MDSRLKSFVSPEILSREGYTPGFQPKGNGNLIKLNTCLLYTSDAADE